MKKRVFLFVLDSFGIGEAPDAAAFGDAGANTIASVATSDKFQVPNMAKLGLFNLDGVACGQPVEAVVKGPQLPPDRLQIHGGRQVGIVQKPGDALQYQLSQRAQYGPAAFQIPVRFAEAAAPDQNHFFHAPCLPFLKDTTTLPRPGLFYKGMPDSGSAHSRIL